ncbi:MAG: hypothetical protein IJ783_11385, partial [Kiritimatiellae bacterium]|nr:hypothetical protein [Kiritimatiellia bacterium]
MFSRSASRAVAAALAGAAAAAALRAFSPAVPEIPAAAEVRPPVALSLGGLKRGATVVSWRLENRDESAV